MSRLEKERQEAAASRALQQLRQRLTEAREGAAANSKAIGNIESGMSIEATRKFHNALRTK